MLLLITAIFALLLFIMVLLHFFTLEKNYSLFYLSMIYLIVSSINLYFLTGQWHSYWQWKKEGEAHYALLAQIESLGGIYGLITRLEQRLAINDKDIKGWQILAKLYLNTNQKEKYEHALMKIKVTQPQ